MFHMIVLAICVVCIYKGSLPYMFEQPFKRGGGGKLMVYDICTSAG